VVVTSRKAAACDETAKHLRAQGGEALAVPCHVGDLDALRELALRTVEAFGAIDVVVNNCRERARAAARGVHAGCVGEVARRQPARAGVPGAGGAAAPEAERHAAVLNVVSGAAFLYASTISLYASRQGGLVSRDQDDGRGVRAVRIRVNALSPGTIDTDMVRKNTPESQDEMTKMQLLPRMAHPDEMVGPALLLTSDAGSFITGSVLFATAAWCRASMDESTTRVSVHDEEEVQACLEVLRGGRDRAADRQETCSRSRRAVAALFGSGAA
jgi:NAD(P)-dependent dehydrogenase (short-subunit alcohol dehydrogenase family)